MTESQKESQIETLLSQIHPKPSERLDEIMTNAPWNQSQKQASFPLQRMAAAVAVLMLFVSLMVVTPLGTMALQFISQFFVPASDDVQTTTFERPEPTPVSEAVYWQPGTLEEAQAQANFVVRVPTMTHDYTLTGAEYYEGEISLHYNVPNDETLGRNLVVRQAPIDLHPYKVGASANIESVSINGAEGEYLRGSWRTTDNQEEGDNITVENTWDSSVQQHILVWTQDGINYSMFYQAAYIPHPAYYGDGAPDQPGYLTKAELIAIAESLQ